MTTGHTTLAAEFNVSSAVPMLRAGAFMDAGGSA